MVAGARIHRQHWAYHYIKCVLAGRVTKVMAIFELLITSQVIFSLFLQHSQHLV
jgi:hypothetical protein